MKTKPLDKIRVTEICRVAEIERPTFYYHFKDKYDLVA
ncbi:MAG TPA: TetR family transcriptional regulator, partial [Ruminococcus flavefaciens]|nr:TetR family transcriptional regulator [Ruminococcus flavefaciens]